MNVEDEIQEAEKLASSDISEEFSQGGPPITCSIEKLTLLIRNITTYIPSKSVRDIITNKLDEPIPKKLSPFHITMWRHPRWTALKTVLKLAIKNIRENSLRPSDDTIQPSPKSKDPKKVFVVHGRNLNARNGIFEFLRAIKLNPIEWAEALNLTESANPSIGEVLEKAFENAQAVIVLMTPDDEARLKEKYLQNSDARYEKELTGQARPNVLFEAGMAMGYYPKRTVLVEVGYCRPFSDIAGKHLIKWDNSTKQRQILANALKRAGCNINLDGTDWHTTGRIAIDLELKENIIKEENKDEKIKEMSSETVKDILSKSIKKFKKIFEHGKPNTFLEAFITANKEIGTDIDTECFAGLEKAFLSFEKRIDKIDNIKEILQDLNGRFINPVASAIKKIREKENKIDWSEKLNNMLGLLKDNYLEVAKMLNEIQEEMSLNICDFKYPFF